MQVTGILLAAGASRRFGAADKLLAPYRGRPLVAHAGAAMGAARLGRRIAVVADLALGDVLPGFELVVMSRGEMADSLRAGVMAATGQGAGAADRLLIALGDMPLVTADHLDRVVATVRDDRPAASLGPGGVAMVPACFPGRWYGRLVGLRGDRGAAALIRDLPEDALVSGDLRDVDRPGDLGCGADAI